MKKFRPLVLFMVLVVLLEVMPPLWSTVYGSDKPSVSEVQKREKIYFEWMTHKYTRNSTGSAILKITKVDYSTGLFSIEDVPLDFVDTSTDYYFDSVEGMRSKQQPYITYTILKSGTKEKIISYNLLKQSIGILADRNKPGESIVKVFPDAGVYVVENADQEFLVYSLSTNKLIHKTKQEPKENSNLFVTNVLFGNYFDPELSLGSIYVEPRVYFDSKTYKYKEYPGEFPYEIKSDGTIVRLSSYKKSGGSENYVYKKKLSGSVIYKESRTGSSIKQDLIINGKVNTLYKTNMKSSKYSFAVPQFSPKGKYIVFWVGFYDNQGRVRRSHEEYHIFNAQTGSLIRKIPINGLSSLVDQGITWVAGTDHIIHLSLINEEKYRTIESNITTPWNHGNVASQAYKLYYTFSLDNYLSLNDPVPVKFQGRYMQYSGQGTFRVADLTTYSPVEELLDLLGGTVSIQNGKTVVTYNDKAYTLDSSKQIAWKGRVYYPLREILTGFGLKLLTHGNKEAANGWKEFEIIE